MALEQVFLALFKKYEKMQIVSGIVSEVRDESIDVKREGMPDLLDVRFNSVLNTVQNQFKVTPKKGSVVLCGIIENDISEAVLLQCSEIEKVQVTIDTTDFEIDTDGYKITRDSINLKDVLRDGYINQNRLNQAVQKIVVAIGVTPDVPLLQSIKSDTETEVINNLIKVLK